MPKLSQEMIDMIARGEAAAGDTGIFGLPKDLEPSLVLLSVPWEPTASFGRGTSEAIEGILEASRQLDVEDLCFDRPYQMGIALAPVDGEIAKMNSEALALVESIREKRDQGLEDGGLVAQVNVLSDKLNTWVQSQTTQYRKNGKYVGVIGGDHSVPFGYIKSIAQEYPEFGILHIDAHFDLRSSFEGFSFSHASIMHNVMTQIPQVSSLVQVGIRDFSREERLFSEEHKNRIQVFYDRSLACKKAQGESFSQTVSDIISLLPKHVYISFDIDGLKREYCPNTGTPVPGGLDYNDVVFLIEELAMSERHKIIGFDLVEVSGGEGESPNPWNFNVAARLLYKLCGALFHSQKDIGKCE